MTIEYQLRDAAGRLIAYHVRTDKPDGSKTVAWRQLSGEWGLNGTPLSEIPLYGAELVSDAAVDELIVLTEGEKARDALETVKIPAVGTVTGASGTPGPEALKVLRDRRVCLWPDNDDAGREHMQRIADALQSVAAEILWFTWNEAPDKGDAADHPAVQSGSEKYVDRLLTNLEGSPQYTPVPEAGNAGGQGMPGLGVLLSDVEAEQVEWLWPGRIPKGKLTIVDGDPGTGKSAATTDLAARVSVGKPWPDGGECDAAGVVICSAEDGLADTIRPRLDAAGGDPSKVLALSTVAVGDAERMISIPEDLPFIEAGIERVGAALVVIDPLMAFLSGEVNSHRDQDVRKALAPLARLAERTGAAIVVVRHLNKATGGAAIYRGGGSIGIVGAARSGLLIAKHPEDDERRVMASIKSNLAPPAPSLVFSLSSAESEAVQVDWKGESALDAAALLSAPIDHEERSALSEAKEFLREALADNPQPASEVRRSSHSAGIAKRTLDRARQSLGVSSEREGEAGKRGGGKWLWRLPEGSESI